MRGGASMRFHPNSLASSDQRPGPNMASAAAIVAVNRLENESPLNVVIADLDDRNRHTSQRGPQPRDQKQSRSREGREGERRGRIAHSCHVARTRRTEPITSRISSKPMPGQPPANVE